MILIATHLFLYLFLIPALSYGADTLAVNQSLSGNQTLVSLDGNFEMGFFKPGNSSNYYIGIWYKKVKTTTIVWVANRETPISNIFSSIFKYMDGNLVLLDESNTQIWSTNMSFTARPASLVLLDDGNLVLRHESQPIWQSFDYPTHTLLPGMKLLYNKRTNTKQVLTSWRNIDDPGMGLFSLEIDQNNKQFVTKWNRSVEYWTSGRRDSENRLFSLVPEKRLNYIYNFSYVDNENETYFTYSLYNPSIISRFIIDVSGQIKQLSWLDTTEQWNLFWSQPRQFCEVSRVCGAFGVCDPQMFPFCSCLADFEPKSQNDWNLGSYSGGCVRKTVSSNIRKDFNLGTVVGSVAGVVFVLAVILLIVRRKKWILVGKTTMEGPLVAFVYRDLQIATKNFSEKLGGGSFGSVFKGVLHDSSIVAVKKLESVSQGEKQFRSEVRTIGIIQHVNLIRLCGFCAQGKSRLLVYDYMPNGSLNSLLFHANQDRLLTWDIRYKIALGIARGLVYLHEKCRDCIIHCDIKPENILLDANFCPKIADFGLAKLMGRDFSRILTTMRGTRGYLAPEWLSGLAVTAKADVFSYGMMLFELIHGKRNFQQSEDLNFTFFPSLASNVLTAGGDILGLLDSGLNREASVEQVTKILKVAYWCIQDEEDIRFSMSQVERILEGNLEVNMPPMPQSVNFFDDDTEEFLFFKQSSSVENSQVESTFIVSSSRVSDSG